MYIQILRQVYTYTKRKFMKYFIAHRGNVNGINPSRENDPDYIKEALTLGYDVEIDVWVTDVANPYNSIYLGHDHPTYHIEFSFLLNTKLWCHAKNFNALTLLIKHKNQIRSFSHNTDEHVLTSDGIIWSYVGKEIDSNTICVLPEKTPNRYTPLEMTTCLGICSDFIEQYR